MKKIVLIKYNAGNIRSVLYALERLGIKAKVTADKEEIQAADKVIFPGVGEASSAMKYLKENGLDKIIKSLKQPILGICLGMQLMCKYSEEGDVECLGLFNAEVKKFKKMQIPRVAYKIPQVGWNDIYHLSSPLFKDIEEKDYVYFVHSYYVEKSVATIATAKYGLPYSAAIQKDNFYAVQFHPEKSAQVGQEIIRNFIEI